MRMISSSPVGRTNYWKKKPNPSLSNFYRQRGLELSPTKTVITHVEKSFDFLGQNVRRYPNGKLLIKPSKKNVKTFLDGIRRIIKASIGWSAADLIGKHNPKIRRWANCHRHVLSKHTFVPSSGSRVTTKANRTKCDYSSPVARPFKARQGQERR